MSKNSIKFFIDISGKIDYRIIEIFLDSCWKNVLQFLFDQCRRNRSECFFDHRKWNRFIEIICPIIVEKMNFAITFEIFFEHCQIIDFRKIDLLINRFQKNLLFKLIINVKIRNFTSIKKIFNRCFLALIVKKIQFIDYYRFILQNRLWINRNNFFDYCGKTIYQLFNLSFSSI